MALLFMAELSDYLKVEIKEDLFVDLSRGQKLRINFDMVFPRIACGCKLIMDCVLDHNITMAKFCLGITSAIKLISSAVHCVQSLD